jgi:hypothetical protein
MKFVVVPLASNDTSVRPDRLTLPDFKSLGEATVTRRVSLNEADSEVLEGIGPESALLGTMDNGIPVHKGWDDAITEHPDLNATEIWEMFNFTADAHPIHIHEVMFQVINRERIDRRGRPRAQESWETGYKDTVIAYPGEITRVKAKFDLPGLYVWHCHIVEHEDNEMMRPYRVGP